MRMQAALFLRRDRLALAPTDEATPRPLADAWRRLQRAMTRRPATPLASDAARLYCLWLAATDGGPADDDSKAPSPRLRAFIAELDRERRPTAAADEPSPSEPGSIAARFSDDALTLARLLRTLDPHSAGVLLDQRLDQDWEPLPAPWRAAIRERAIDRAAEFLTAELAAAADSDALLRVASRYARRPALLVAALAWLAANRRPADQAANQAAAAFVLAMHRRLEPRPDDDATTLPALPSAATLAATACRRIATWIDDPQFQQRLATLLEQGADQRRRLQHRVENLGRVELDGLALGSRLPANQLITDLAEELGTLELHGVASAASPHSDHR